VCGKLSHVIASSRFCITVATLLVIVVFAVLGALIEHPVLGALLGIPFALTYNIRAWTRAEMFPISADASSSARKVGWLVNLLALLGILALEQR
jgi:4-hydroxybenzoate polyprenyltransferase